MLWWVTIATLFLPLFLFHCYGQVAAILTFFWDIPAKLLFRRRHQAISYLNTLPNYIYLTTLPNYTLSHYITELLPVWIHYRTVPYLNTLPKYLFSSIKSQQYPPALLLTAGIIFSPNRSCYTRGPGKKFKNFFVEEVSQCQKWVFEHTPYLHTLQNPIAFGNMLVFGNYHSLS